MALPTKDKIDDEWFCNIPPFLSIVVYAMRPVLLRTIQGEVHENLAARLPTGKTGGRKEIRLQKR
jgi:hypothetical protein